MANRYIQSAESRGSVVLMNLIPRRIAERQAPRSEAGESGAIIDICTFAQEKRIPSFLSQASELNPQPPSHQAAVEIKDALPFDESIGSDVVIADPESLDAN
jgi:hypothetical protein